MNLREARARAKRVRAAVFDVDGILTDGSLLLADAGDETKAFNTRDGHGMRMLQDAGIVLAILTGRRSSVVELRARDLGIAHVLQGAKDKREGLADLVARTGVPAEAMSYMGDDVVDLPALTVCAFAATVPEAPAIVRAHAHWITAAPGGRGAIREVSEFILSAQGRLAARWTPLLA
jgi:3-deoxy-D-manno-octulosonate 8-phosphate phosphatase (KDO 8-P phosphatase)